MNCRAVLFWKLYSNLVDEVSNKYHKPEDSFTCLRLVILSNFFIIFNDTLVKMQVIFVEHQFQIVGDGYPVQISVCVFFHC